MIPPDPVQAAAAYQAMLLTALGDDDPAEVQASTPAAIRRLVTEAGGDLRTAPAPGEWSVLGCLAHIVDGELISAARYRWIVAEDQPDIVAYDQAIWVDRLHGPADDPEGLMALFEALRRSNLTMWAGSTPEQRARIGMHRERGQESYDLMFRMLAGHDRIHMAQARAALDAARSAR
jgi:DinB superfamily